MSRPERWKKRTEMDMILTNRSGNIGNPWELLALAIISQGLDDLNFIEQHGGDNNGAGIKRYGEYIYKSEIMKFFKGGWINVLELAMPDGSTVKRMLEERGL